MKKTKTIVPVPETETDRRRRRMAAVGCGFLATAMAGLLVIKIYLEQRDTLSPGFDAEVSGTTVEIWDAGQVAERRMDVEWADEDYRATTNAHILSGVLMWPDIYPEHRLHSGQSWHAKWPDEGLEWFAVRWNSKVRAQAVILVETWNPGAIVAVDDLVDAHSPTLGTGMRVRLWSGELPSLRESRVLVLQLAEPRYMDGLRVVLDTHRHEGYNAIDAVGLLPFRRPAPG